MSDRHVFRAKWHDYASGIYFVTVCTHEMRHLFGTINNGVMRLTALGNIVDGCVNQIPLHYENTEVLNYVVMPNHIHIVIAVETQYIAHALTPTPMVVNRGCLRPPMHGEPSEDFHHNSVLAQVVGTFKAAVTRMTCRKGMCIWQRLFHDHIIRNKREFDKIMNYVDNNITNWKKDCFYS